MFDSRLFWVNVQKTPTCWLWRGTLFANGYGSFGSGRHGTRYAHRLAWIAINGPIPDGMFLCHTCDNRRCVNPAHLFVGTQADNMADCARKGRVWGQAKPMTHEVADRIRRLHAKGMRKSEIGRRVGVANTVIDDVVSGTHWTARVI